MRRREGSPTAAPPGVNVNLVSANRTLTALRRNGRLRAQLLSGAGILAGVGAGLAPHAYFREPLRAA